jgi:hypothetical protein
VPAFVDNLGDKGAHMTFLAFASLALLGAAVLLYSMEEA